MILITDCSKNSHKLLGFLCVSDLAGTCGTASLIPRLHVARISVCNIDKLGIGPGNEVMVLLGIA